MNGKHLFLLLPQPGSYSFYIGDAVLEIDVFLICVCNVIRNFQFILKIEIIGAALQQALIITQIFGAALQHR